MDKKIYIVACVLIILIVTIPLIGAFLLPILIRIDDSIDLGHQYRYIQDYPHSIIYHNTKEYKGVGAVVIPHVSKYDFDEKFIIAKSWIIDKNKHQAYQFDSDSVFKVYLHQLNISINLD